MTCETHRLHTTETHFYTQQKRSMHIIYNVHCKPVRFFRLIASQAIAAAAAAVLARAPMRRATPSWTRHRTRTARVLRPISSQAALPGRFCRHQTCPAPSSARRSPLLADRCVNHSPPQSWPHRSHIAQIPAKKRRKCAVS